MTTLRQGKTAAFRPRACKVGVEGSRPIIPGKLHAPMLDDPTLIERPRLTDQFGEDPGCPVTLIVAPAGHGKTTAAAQFLARSGAPGAWLSLDPWDNDPSRFLDYMFAALRTAGLDTPVADIEQVNPDAMVAALAQVLAAAPAAVTLVLDDLHVVSNELVLEAIALLVSYIPDRLRLVITSRTTPALPLARWRLLGKVREVTAEELRFTLAETGSVAERVAHRQLGAATVEHLHRWSEGWVAAIRVGLFGHQGLADQQIAAHLRRPVREQRDVLALLDEQVLDQMPPGWLAFLTRASLFDRLSDDLCSAVLGDAIACVPLRELARSGVLLSPIKGAGAWYRVHALLGEALQRRLEETVPDEQVMRIHQRASDWFAERGDFESSIDHALRSQDWNRATAMIQPLIERMTAVNRIDRLHQWLEAVPHAVIHENAEFCYSFAWTLVREGLVDEAQPFIARAEEIWSAQGNMAMCAAALNIRATSAFYRGLGPECVGLSREAERSLPVGMDVERLTARLNLGLGSSMSGRVNDASAILAELAAAAGTVESVRLVATIQLGWVDILQGRLDRAEYRLRRVIETHAHTRLDAVRRAYVWLADIAIEQEREGEAATLLAHADRLTSEAGSTPLIADTALRRARLLLRRGQPEAALSLLDSRLGAGSSHGATPVSSGGQALRVACWTCLGWDDEVRRWISHAGLTTVGPIRYGNEPLYVAYADWLLCHDRWAPAKSIAERLCRLAETDGRDGDLLASLLLLARAELGAGTVASAGTAASRALALAERGGYRATVLSAGEPLHGLFWQLARRGQATDYVARMLGTPAQPPDALKRSELADLLTDREIEIMRKVALGHANQHIADDLDITLATVKRHIANIFSKLKVSSRTEAVFRARQLGVL